MRAALERVMVRLQDCLGKDRAQWHWDRLHRTGPVHRLSPVFPELAPLLNPPSVGMGGDSDTVAAAAFAPAGEFILTSTSVARYVFDLADWDRSGWVVPLGASGHPGSPHYADQVGPWSEYRLLPMLFSWDRIRAEAESHQVLDRCEGARLARGPE
jgi:penicillin amidase